MATYAAIPIASTEVDTSSTESTKSISSVWENLVKRNKNSRVHSMSTSLKNRVNRLRTPSVSVTPPSFSSTEENGDTPAEPPNTSSQEDMVSGMQNIQLSKPCGVSNPSALAAAVDTLDTALTNDVASLLPKPPRSRDGTPQQRRSRRRSSAKIDKAPHSVLDEELPKDAFHSPEFQQAYRDAKQLMSNVESVLGSSSLHNNEDSTMCRLHKEAGELARFEYPSSRTVGFVGDSGVGKSSLLNSLLDAKGLARTSNSGEACTCVVTEYHYHNQDMLAIEVDLFSKDELHAQLKSMLRAYRHFHTHQDEINDSAEKSDMEASANVARDTFRAMFRGQLGDEGFLISQSEMDVIQTLTTWAANARPSETKTRQSGLSMKDCSTKLMELSSEPPSRNQPAIWPYIRSTKVFLNAHILSRGLVLVDLPGLRDLNSARRIITERYLLRCNEIFAICNIGRAVTDEGVHQVFELARQARLSNVGIVCTRSDDILAEEAMRDWRGERAKTIKQLVDIITNDAKDEIAVQEDLDEYAGEDDLSEDEMHHQRDLYRQHESIRTRKTNHEFELTEYLVTTRNAFITKELRSEYNKRVAVDEIKVFCVSNKVYWDNREKPKAQSRRLLDLSGILQVRKHCISIVANSQRRAATRYMRDEIPALLVQVSLWVQSGAPTGNEERREALCKTLDEVERILISELTSNTGNVRRVSQLFKKDFEKYILANLNISSWTQQARTASNKWSTWHHATYAAFCRNYGDYCTPKVGPHNWNEEAMAAMVLELETPWEELRSSIQQRCAALTGQIDGITDAAIQKFATNLGNGHDSAATILEALSTRQELLLDAIDQAQEQLEDNLGLLRINSLSGIRSSVMGRAMEPLYEECLQDSGAGVDARRKAVINGAFSREDLFRALMRSFKDGFRSKVTVSQERINSATKSYLGGVHKTFELVRSENVARESEQDPEFRLRVDSVSKAGRETMQRIHGVIGA